MTSEASPTAGLSIAVSAEWGSDGETWSVRVNLLSGEILKVVREDGTEGEEDQADLQSGTVLEQNISTVYFSHVDLHVVGDKEFLC